METKILIELQNVWFKWNQCEAKGNIQVTLIPEQMYKLLIFKNSIGNVLFRGHLFNKSFVVKCKQKTFMEDEGEIVNQNLVEVQLWVLTYGQTSETRLINVCIALTKERSKEF